jgi:hypothetical protein
VTPTIDLFQYLLTACLLGLLAILISVRLTEKQRFKWKILRKLDGKQPIFVFLAIVVVVVAGLLQYWKYNISQSVSISPSSISFGFVPNETYMFSVNNNNDDSVYLVAAIVRTDSDNFEPDDFQISVPIGSIQSIPGSRQPGDVFGMNCRDAKKRVAIPVWIYWIGGHGMRVFTISRRKSRVGQMKAKIVGFRRGQLPVRNDPNRSLIPFDVGETLTCSSMTPTLLPER